MARLDDLNSALDNMAARLKEITASPKPTYDIDGQKFSWTEYQRFLIEAMSSLREQVAAEDGPYVEESQVYTDPPYGA